MYHKDVWIDEIHAWLGASSTKELLKEKINIMIYDTE